jgi:hypothetical protein
MADLDVSGLGGEQKMDAELQEFLMVEKQRAQVNAQVSKMKNKSGEEIFAENM